MKHKYYPWALLPVIFGALAEFERELITEHTLAGLASPVPVSGKAAGPSR